MEQTGFRYYSTDRWEEAFWRQLRPVYEAGFAEHGRKPEAVIRRMFSRKLCRLHGLFDGDWPVAMALSGADSVLGAMVIDYLAVAPARRGSGIGRRFLEDIKEEALRHAGAAAGQPELIGGRQTELTGNQQELIRGSQPEQTVGGGPGPLRGIIVEVEAEETPENLGRIRFWEACGFRLTDYVHPYIWVPEPYRAMALSFPYREPLPLDGRELFAGIIRFHERAYRK